jgi:AraC-like DNA-binding protein
MRYEEFPPPAPVAACVACLWTLTGAGDTAAFDLILPDGRPELVVHRGDPFRQRLASGATRRQPRRLVVGQMTGAVALAPGRRVESIGVRFTPAGLSPLCGFAQADLADRLVAVDDLQQAPLLQTLAAAAAGAPTTVAALDALRDLLVRVYATAPPPDPGLLRAVVAIAESGGDVAMDALAATAGVSSRWLERHFQNAVGVSPKRLARLVRFRRVLAALDANPADRGAAVALDHGYYDQAHFIADFRAFAGDAPRRFVDRRLAELTRFFVDRSVAP